MTDKEVMQMALNELEDRNSDRFYETTKKVCEILEAKLAQPEPDQDGFVFIEARWGKDFFEIQVPDCIGEIVRIYHKQWRGESQPEHFSDCAVYNEPAYPKGECDCKPTKLINVNGVLEQAGYVKKKEWVGLTHTELEDCILSSKWATWIEVGRAIEAKLKEKNI